VLLTDWRRASPAVFYDAEVCVSHRRRQDGGLIAGSVVARRTRLHEAIIEHYAASDLAETQSVRFACPGGD